MEGVTLRKHADPTEGYRDGLSVAEAQAIIQVDPSLIYCHVQQDGWLVKGVAHWSCAGYNADSYFRGSEYLGPDEYDAEPRWVDASEQVDSAE